MDNQNYKQILIQRAYKFSLSVMKFINTLPRQDFSAEIIARQLIRSATSIGANIIEAQAASSKKDFTNFLTHSLKSANETKYWLGLLRDGTATNKQKANELLQETIELAKLLGSSVLALKGKK